MSTKTKAILLALIAFSVAGYAANRAIAATTVPVSLPSGNSIDLSGPNDLVYHVTCSVATPVVNTYTCSLFYIALSSEPPRGSPSIDKCTAVESAVRACWAHFGGRTKRCNQYGDGSGHLGASCTDLNGNVVDGNDCPDFNANQ